MTKLQKKFVWCFLIIALLSVVSIIYLQYGLGLAVAKGHGGSQALLHSSGGSQNVDSTRGDQQPQKTAAVAGSVDSKNGPIYAHRDVVDMTRLVLEISRDQTLHTNHVIERATHVVVILFVVLGAIAGLWGIHKVDEFDEKVDKLLKRHEASVESSAQAANQELQKLINAHQKMSDESLKSLDKQREAMVELIAGRIYIDQGLTYFEAGRADLSTEWFKAGVDRINRVLSKHPEVSPQSRLRSLAGVGYAYKRLGKVDAAYAALVQAVEIAKTHQDESLAFLNFNASCYAALLSKSEECFQYLKDAIVLDQEHKASAVVEMKAGGDFHSIKDSAEFLAIIK